MIKSFQMLDFLGQFLPLTPHSPHHRKCLPFARAYSQSLINLDFSHHHRHQYAMLRDLIKFPIGPCRSVHLKAWRSVGLVPVSHFWYNLHCVLCASSRRVLSTNLRYIPYYLFNDLISSSVIVQILRTTFSLVHIRDFSQSESSKTEKWVHHHPEAQPPNFLLRLRFAMDQ